MPQRTFLALDLEEATLDRMEIARRGLDAPGAGARWVARENLHLTLLFLGDVADEVLPQVCDLSAGAAGFVKPFEYEVRGLLAVPPAGALRMIWAGVEDPSGHLAELQAHLAAAMAGLGLREEERGFRPHITLARIKSMAPQGRGGKAAQALRQETKAYAETSFGTQFAEEVVVYGSQLTQEGPIYTPLARAPLGK
jgi:2'-5' RNA ligase